MTSGKEKRFGREAYEWVRTLVCSALMLLLVFTFVIRVIRVDGESMRETLQDRDLLLALTDTLCSDYQAGDIVILQKEGFHDGAPIVKRVVAVEGQTVDIDFDAGVVYVDGKVLEEDYIRQPTYTPEGLEFPVTVPKDHVFVLGDNRNDSHDSRSAELGPVDVRCVIGKAVFLMLPGKTAELEKREWSRIGFL